MDPDSVGVLTDDDAPAPVPTTRLAVPGLGEWGRELPLYALVGLLVFAIDLSVYWLLVSGAAWFLHAHMIARVVGGVACFVLHRTITFRRAGPACPPGRSDAWGQGFRYGILYGVSFLVSGALVYALVEAASLGPLPGKLGAELLTFLFNYSVMKYWVMPAAPPAA